MKVLPDFPLATTLFYRIGGTARYLLEVESREDIFRALEFVERERPARVFVVGLGSNLVFPDGCFDGVVVRVAAGESPAIRAYGDDGLESFGGVVLDDVVRASFCRGLTGLEWAGGLPGTLGAGVRGNVGAFGGELKDCLEAAELVSLTPGAARVQRLSRDELGFAYRDSLVKREPGLIVAGAWLRLRPSGAEQLAAARAVYERNIAYRRQRHPMEYPNCGSVFKNIHERQAVEQVLARWPDIEPRVRGEWHGKVSMGYIIGRLGLSGLREGNARISEKHNNFIVNLGGATAASVRALIARVQEAVAGTFGFVPEVEIEIVS